MKITHQISKRFIDEIKPSNKSQEFYWDSELKGFGMRITANGAKSYVVQYRNLSGQSKRSTIGKHTALTPTEARKIARSIFGDVAKGLDPQSEKQENRKAQSVRKLAQDYLERHAIPNKTEASLRDDKAMIEKIILPKLGTRLVKDVTSRDVAPVIYSLSKTPYRGNRVRALISKMFSLSVSWGWRSDNPTSGIKKFPEEKRIRWLDVDELERLSTALNSHENVRAANVVRLLLLTGARRGEALKATWDQFDFKRGKWVKPAHTTKQKRVERIPLSAPVLELLTEIKAAQPEGTNFVFPGNKEGQPLQDIKKFWYSIREEAEITDVRIHDLRHTYASHLVSEGFSLAIVGKLLGHTQAQTTMRYAHLADESLKRATDSFGTIFDNSYKAKNHKNE